MSTNPHVDNAALIVQRVVEEEGAWYDDNAEALLRAQIQATLAVAYEQRTANLIAAFSQLVDGDSDTFLGERVDGLELANQIKERLDLA